MSTIRTSQTVATKINNIIHLSLNHPQGKNTIWVLVEGETDKKLYSKLIDAGSIKIEYTNGITDLLTALAQLTLITDKVIAIRDADFLHLDNQQPTEKHLFITDKHDAEMMLIACDNSFKAIISEYLTEQLNQFIPLRADFLASIAFLGGFRWLNDKENLELNFKGINFDKFYQTDSLSIDKQACINDVINRSANKKRVVASDEITDLISDISDYYNLCNGHDAQKAIARYITINNNGKGITDTRIAECLRVAYQKQDFITTQLYQELLNWQHQTGYYLFAD
jgi:hypothetical protein